MAAIKGTQIDPVTQAVLLSLLADLATVRATQAAIITAAATSLAAVAAVTAPPALNTTAS